MTIYVAYYSLHHACLVTISIGWCNVKVMHWLPAGTIKALSAGTSYKYPNVLEAEGFQHDKVKVELRKCINRGYLVDATKSKP